jgi:hypothetical protein
MLITLFVLWPKFGFESALWPLVGQFSVGGNTRKGGE